MKIDKYECLFIEEILLDVFMLLDPYTLIKWVPLVCKKWKQVVDSFSNKDWRSICIRYFPKCCINYEYLDDSPSKKRPYKDIIKEFVKGTDIFEKVLFKEFPHLMEIKTPKECFLYEFKDKTQMIGERIIETAIKNREDDYYSGDVDDIDKTIPFFILLVECWRCFHKDQDLNVITEMEFKFGATEYEGEVWYFSFMYGPNSSNADLLLLTESVAGFGTVVAKYYECEVWAEVHGHFVSQEELWETLFIEKRIQLIEDFDFEYSYMILTKNYKPMIEFERLSRVVERWEILQQEGKEFEDGDLETFKQLAEVATATFPLFYANDGGDDNKFENPRLLRKIRQLFEKPGNEKHKELLKRSILEIEPEGKIYYDYKEELKMLMKSVGIEDQVVEDFIKKY